MINAHMFRPGTRSYRLYDGILNINKSSNREKGKQYPIFLYYKQYQEVEAYT